MVLEWPQFHWVNFDSNPTKPSFMPAKPFSWGTHVVEGLRCLPIIMHVSGSLLLLHSIHPVAHNTWYVAVEEDHAAADEAIEIVDEEVDILEGLWTTPAKVFQGAVATLK